jgi:N-ethylmaleimide reductase
MPCILFEPFQLGALELPNRIVMAPLTRQRAAPGNVPTELNALYYAQRSSAGLIVSEATQVAPEGQGYADTPGIHSDAQVEGWRLVTDAVHRAGGRIVLQLWHVGRISDPCFQPNRGLPIAPSALPAPGEVHTPEGPKPFVTPRALALEEIATVIAQYAEGAKRARRAGFDGVEVHAANGYLIDQFLHDGTNHRTDAYGGSIENRSRFLLEVTRAVSDAWSPDRVGVRLSPRGRFNGMRDSNRSLIFSHAVQSLDELGLAYLHLVDPVRPSPFDNPEEPRLAPRLRTLFRGPMILNGAFDRDAAIQTIEAGEADLVAFGTAFIANPDLPERLRLEAPLARADRASFYGGGARGYTDYPPLSLASSAASEPAGNR